MTVCVGNLVLHPTSIMKLRTFYENNKRLVTKILVEAFLTIQYQEGVNGDRSRMYVDDRLRTSPPYETPTRFEWSRCVCRSHSHLAPTPQVAIQALQTAHVGASDSLRRLAQCGGGLITLIRVCKISPSLYLAPKVSVTMGVLAIDDPLHRGVHSGQLKVSTALGLLPKYTPL